MNRKKRLLPAGLALLVCLCFFVSCSDRSQDFSDMGGAEIPLASGIPETALPTATASGTKTEASALVSLDYSNTADGYLMLKYTGTNSKVKTQITGPNGTTYTYNQALDGSFDVYPLSEGDGSYKLCVYENISEQSYACIFSFRVTVSLKNEFSPFLISNKYVNYNYDSKVVKKAAELCSNKKTVLAKISAVYSYVIQNFSYDYTLAKTVKSGYIPELDAVMDKKIGICFDYAAVMTAMLRSQSIPTKLVFGYTGSVYHAWILTYSPERGWLTTFIYFDGKNWKLMDPTFASTGESSSEIMAYIGNVKNYTAKYLY